MLSKERKAELAKKFGKNETDTGSAAVQVAIITERIGYLTPHLKDNKHDYSSKRGMMKLIGKRRRFLRFIQNQDAGAYQNLIKELGLRK